MANNATGVLQTIGIDGSNRTVVRMRVTRPDGREVDVDVFTNQITFAKLANLGVRVYNEGPRDSKAQAER